MANGNKGPIGLPIRRAQTRNALIMSAIQEERASTMSTISVASKPSVSCSSSPSTSSSSPDLSPNQHQVASSHQEGQNFEAVLTGKTTAQTITSSSLQSRSVAKFEEVDTSPTFSPSLAPPPIVRTQSARMRSAQRLADVPLAGVKGLKSAMAKQMQSISARTRSIPYFSEASTTTTAPTSVSPPKKKTSSERSRPVSCFDDSFLEKEAKNIALNDDSFPEKEAKKTARNDSNTTLAPISAIKKLKNIASERSRRAPCFDDSFLEEEAKKKKRADTKKINATTAKSLRSRPIPCFDDDDLLVSGPVPQTKKNGWKPRVIRTRPASGPILSVSPSSCPILQVSSSPTALDEIQHVARRRNSNPSPSAVAKPARSNSPTNLTDAKSKLAIEYRSRRHFPSKENTSVSRLRASSDGESELQPTLQLGNQDVRSRALSDSTLVQIEKKSSLRLRHYEGKFQNRRGQSLLYFSLFPPEKLAMRGIILHIHGMGDHCRRNTALYERYCSEGFGVIAYDLLNHGASDYDKYRIRAHINDFNELVDDTNDFIAFAKTNIYKVALRYWRKHHHPFHPHGKDKKRKSLPELPLIITGNSLGSLIGLHTILSGKQKFHAAVWASPSIGVTWNPVLWAQWKFAKALLTAFPTAKMIPAVPHNLRSRNPQFLIDYQKDPLTCVDMITPRTGCQVIRAINRLHQDARVPNADTPFCSIPMLFLAGTHDRISDQQASLKFFTRMGSFDKEFKFFEGLYHMIYDEPEQEDVLAYLINWLHKRFPLETRHPNNSPKKLTDKLEPSLRQHDFSGADRTIL